MRELLRAVLKRKRLIALIELDDKRGGLETGQVYTSLVTVHQRKTYSAWGLTAEVLNWGHSIPSPEQLRTAIFRREIVEWNRCGRRFSFHSTLFSPTLDSHCSRFSLRSNLVSASTDSASSRMLPCGWCVSSFRSSTSEFSPYLALACRC